MPDRTSPSIDIQSVEAEIAEAGRQADRLVRQPSEPAPDQMDRMVAEAMARRAWMTARLSAE